MSNITRCLLLPGALSEDKLKPLKDFLIIERATKDPKKLKAILQWIHSIFRWSSICLESLYDAFGKN